MSEVLNKKDFLNDLIKEMSEYDWYSIKKCECGEIITTIGTFEEARQAHCPNTMFDVYKMIQEGHRHYESLEFEQVAYPIDYGRRISIMTDVLYQMVEKNKSGNG